MSDATPARPARPPFLASLGPRAQRRAEPRASVALAAAGCLLALAGVLVVAVEAGSRDDSFNRAPGLGLAALVTAVGMLALRELRSGALATAASVATALGLPALVVFAFGIEGYDPPLSSILGVSTVLWLGAYTVGPAKGRPVFLGLGLLGAWSVILELVEGGFAGGFSLLPVSVVVFGAGEWVEDTASEIGYGGFGFGPDLASIGVLSIVIGAAYVLVSRRLDRAGWHGAAHPFAIVALPALLQGAVALAFDIGLPAGGLVVTAVGVGLALHGGTSRRRVTTWLGALAAIAGIAAALLDVADSVATVAALLFVAGGVVVGGAHLLQARLDEPDELARTDGEPPRRRTPLVAAPR